MASNWLQEKYYVGQKDYTPFVLKKHGVFYENKHWYEPLQVGLADFCILALSFQAKIQAKYSSLHILYAMKNSPSYIEYKFFYRKVFSAQYWNLLSFPWFHYQNSL